MAIRDVMLGRAWHGGTNAMSSTVKEDGIVYSIVWEIAKVSNAKGVRGHMSCSEVWINTLVAVQHAGVGWRCRVVIMRRFLEVVVV